MTAAVPAFAQPLASAMLQPEGYLSTTPTGNLRRFGYDVALDGDTVAIGAPRPRLLAAVPAASTS